MKFIIQGCKDMLESNGGLAPAGKILAGLELDRRLDGIAIEGALEPKISNADVVRAYVGLLVLGKTDYDAVEPYRHNGYFRRALGIKRVPSSATLRQRLDGAAGRFDSAIKEANAALLSAVEMTGVKT